MTTNQSQPVFGPEERPARNTLRVRLGALRDLLMKDMIDSENRRIAVKVAQEGAIAADQLEAVKELHRRTEEDGISHECAMGECDHDDAFERGEECPTFHVAVCRECFGHLNLDDETPIPQWAEWPCATANALGESD